MQKNEEMILKYILLSRHGDDYGVISVGDISEYLSPISIDEKEISFAISCLEKEGYILLTYSDSDQYCLKPTEKGIKYFTVKKSFKNNNKNIFVTCLFYGFFGGVLSFLLLYIIGLC